MRSQDPHKREAVCKAAVRLINRHGFAGVSMARIAKEAGVSPATIYIYFENKDDLLQQLYLDTKKELAAFLMHDFDPQAGIETAVKALLYRHWFFFYQHPEAFAFIEQCSNSPMMAGLEPSPLADEILAEGASYYRPVTELILQAQAAGVIRNLPMPILQALAFAPLIRLAKLHAGQNIQPQQLEEVIETLWNSIKA